MKALALSSMPVYLLLMGASIIKNGELKIKRPLGPKKRKQKSRTEGSISLALIDAPCAPKAPSFIGALSVGIKGLLGYIPADLERLEDLYRWHLPPCLLYPLHKLNLLLTAVSFVELKFS